MRALVVDDSSLQRRFVTWLLREFRNLEVSEAADSVTALNMLLQEPVTLVLMELKLPGMDGLTLLHKLRNSPGPNAQCKVVVISTLSDETTRSRAKELGVVEFLTKPVPAIRVRDVVREQLAEPSKTGPAGSEKRRTPRFSLSVTVVFPDDPPVELQTSDISPFGAFLATDKPKAVGAVGKMTLTLPHQEPLTVEFRVMHVRSEVAGDLPQGFGVRFITEDPHEQARLVKAFETPL